MTAVQPVFSSPDSSSLPQRPRRQRPQRPRYHHSALKQEVPPASQRALLFEVTAKFSLSLILAAATVSALTRLFPYYQAQATRLQKIEQAVALAEIEAADLRQSFNRYFDPAQASHIMQEQSGRESPSQKTVVWVEPTY